MEVGLNLLAIYKNGEVFDKEILFISEEEYINRIQNIAREATNLAVYVAYPAQEVIEILLQKAEREKLSLEKNINLEEQPEEPKQEEESKAEKPVEEPKEEPAVQEEPKEIIEENKPVEEQPKQQETQQLKNPTEYSEEDAQKAQEIINKMKDNSNGG